MGSWYRHGLMVLTTPMVLTQTHGIVLVLLNHTRTRGPSVTRVRDFFNALPTPRSKNMYFFITILPGNVYGLFICAPHHNLHLLVFPQ